MIWVPHEVEETLYRWFASDDLSAEAITGLYEKWLEARPRALSRPLTAHLDPSLADASWVRRRPAGPAREVDHLCAWLSAEAARGGAPSPRPFVSPPDDEQGLLRAVIAGPGDMGPRHAVARLWIDEGDLRGHLVRLQLALDTLPEGARAARREPARRVHRLLHRHARAWAGPLRSAVRGFRFQRGFVEEITVDPEIWLARAEALLAMAPIRRVRLRTRPTGAALEALEAAPFRARIDLVLP